MALLSPSNAILFQRYHGLDWIVLLLLVIINIILAVATKPFCRAFEWSDPTIGYPERPDTFPNYSLALMIIFGLVFIVVFVKFAAKPLREVLPEPLTVFGFMDVAETAEAESEEGRYRDRQDNRQNPTGPLYPWIRQYVWAVVLQLFMTQLMKNYAGRLRPDYIDRLHTAGFTASNTTLPSPMKDPQYYCNLMDQFPALKEGRLSFPSGHSSTSFACCLSLTLFLFSYLRPGARQGSFARFCLAASPLLVAVFCAVSRTRDNKHNFSDILAGSLIGIVTPILSFYICFREAGGAAALFLARSDKDVELVLYKRSLRQIENQIRGNRYDSTSNNNNNNNEKDSVMVNIDDNNNNNSNSNSNNALLDILSTRYSSEKGLNEHETAVPWI
ncbi:PAP2 superfamily, putative [Angomonas deanei]|uniref:PAP2 superfamily, putative n=1 Tax=Angomonas deanei TaxID=59799 RepID=A0A7G2CF57_9TRYP|nr:PAP2 superfamily, putative [Angomonas deanei]